MTYFNIQSMNKAEGLKLLDRLHKEMIEDLSRMIEEAKGKPKEMKIIEDFIEYAKDEINKAKQKSK